MQQIKYIDHRKISIPQLKFHKGGLTLPHGDNIVKVTDSEKRSLMKQHNGQKPCWEEVKPKRKPDIIKVDEDENGDR